MATTKSKKEKERRMIRALLPHIKQIDPHAYAVAGSGAGLHKGDIYCPNLNLVIEAKNWKTLLIQDWMKQSIGEGLGSNKTMVIFRNPKSAEKEEDFWVVTDFYTMKKWLIRAREPMTEKPDREFKWKLYKLKVAANEVIKDI